MLPGKKYAPEDLLRVAQKRVWWLLVPFAIVAAGTAVVAKLLPNQYRSETTLVVVPQRVPENYVQPTVNTRIEDRLQAIAQQILSRTRLERIIEEFNLYADERRTGIMEDIVQDMRDDITLDVIEGDAFRVTYVGDDARTVMRVTERLASAFIDENMRDREQLAEGTNQFLEAQVEDARQRLADHEQRLEAYRLQYAGQLPSQMQGNLQALQNVQMQIRAVIDSAEHDRTRKMQVERQLADLENGAPMPEPPRTEAVVEAPGRVTGGTTAQQLAAARAFLAALQQRYRETHPDVQTTMRLVADLEQKLNQEALSVPLSVAAAEPAMPPAEAARLQRLTELRQELAALTAQIDQKEQEERDLRGQAAAYQARIEAVPTRESDMSELMRDYDTLNEIYTGLVEKREASKLSANLERRQIGEQFKLLDPARIAERPISPNRPRINFLGVIAGLAVGIGLIALLEYRDSSFKTDREVTSLLGLPVLAVVPVMQSDRDRRKSTRRRWLRVASLGSTVAGCLLVFAYCLVTELRF